MPVLINTETGAAEDVPKELADESLASGKYEIPLSSPQGDIVSAPLHSARSLVSKEGHSQLSPEQIKSIFNQTKYGSTSQQLIGTLEQVGRGALGPLPTIAEKAAGVPNEDIVGREEEQSTMQKMLGQGAGLVGGAMLIPGGGQAKALTRAGEVGAELLGLGEATTTFAKVGSAAAKEAVGNATMQFGDEITKTITSDDPKNVEQVAGSALMNIGLAGAIGAGIGGTMAGVVSPLWTATFGPNSDNLLMTLANKGNGESPALSEEMTSLAKAMEARGVKVSPEIMAGLSENPMLREQFKTLVESGSTTGEALRETLEKFKGDVAGQLGSVFQKEGALTVEEAGEKAIDVFRKKAEELNDVISSKYGEIMPHLESVQVPDNARLKLYDSLISKGQEMFGTDSPFYGLFKNYGERVLARDSVAALKQLSSEIGTEAAAAQASRDFNKSKALYEIYGSIKDFQKSQLIAAGTALEKQGVPGANGLGKTLVKDLAEADKLYAEFVGTAKEIAGAGKLGKATSHGSLMAALDKKSATGLVDAFVRKTNIKGLAMLKEKFPEAFDAIVNAKKTAIYDAATKTGDLKHNSILNSVNGLPREIRDMMFSKEEQNIINTSGSVLRESNKRMNPSGTAMTLDKLMSGLPAGVGALAGVLLGHGAMAGALAGQAAHLLGKEAPDAAKLSLLKFLGSSAPVDGTAWKAAADYIGKALKGEALLVNATKAAVKAGQQVLPKSQIPDQKTREKLDKKLKALETDASPMLEVGGKIGHYMPAHAEAIAGVSMNAVNYLNQLRPKQIKLSPLDSEIEPSKSELSDYHRALDIAQQPLILMQSIQDGNLTPRDLAHLTSLYPTAHGRMALGLTDAMVNRASKEEPIKYKQRLSLSMFLAQPLDSTMTPMGIIGTQPQQAMDQAQQPQSQSQQTKPSQVTGKAMTNLAKGNATGGQAREMQKSGMIKA